MKKIVSGGAAAAMMFLTGIASANVKTVELWAGRLSAPEACFVQVDLKEVEQSMFNGQETLRLGGMPWTTFSSLTGAHSSLSAGSSVLIGSPKFGAEAGLAPDISIPDTECAKLVGGSVLDFLGSFGPEAGKLEVKSDFSELEVVGQLLLFDLERQEFKLRSLAGEKTIGTAGGAGSSSGGSSGGSSSGSSSGSTTNSGGTAPAPSGGSDDSCAVHGTGVAGAPSPMPVLGALLGLAALTRRRKKR